jgi:hypothetical protein
MSGLSRAATGRANAGSVDRASERWADASRFREEVGMRPNPEPGDEVLVFDALGEWLFRIAISGYERGRNFPVVWVKRMGMPDLDAVPWPAEDVFVCDLHLSDGENLVAARESRNMPIASPSSEKEGLR